MSTTFSDLPTEILDQFASCLDVRADLLSLAIASRVCKDIIIPRHIEYRVIKCRLRSPIWSHLDARPDLARNVRVVHIIPTSSVVDGLREMLPSTLVDVAWLGSSGSSDGLQGVLRTMRDALLRMEGLETFRWPIHEPIQNSLDQSFWENLQQQTSLVNISFPDIQNFHDPSPLRGFSNLRSLALTQMRNMGAKVAEDLQIIMDNSPNLESLTLCTASDTSIFVVPLADGLWPRLRKLSINVGRNRGRITSPSFARFLDRHPALEDVEWTNYSPDRLETGSLPALRRLHCTDWHYGVSSILATRVSSPRPIESLSPFRLTPAYRSTLAYMNLGTIRRLNLQFFQSLEYLQRLVELLPRLDWLRVPSIDYDYDWGLTTAYPIRTYEWKDFLSKFPQLEVFLGVSFFTDPEMPNQNGEIASNLALHCPNLRHLEHWNHRIRINRRRILELVKECDEVKIREIELRDPDLYFVLDINMPASATLRFLPPKNFTQILFCRASTLVSTRYQTE